MCPSSLIVLISFRILTTYLSVLKLLRLQIFSLSVLLHCPDRNGNRRFNTYFSFSLWTMYFLISSCQMYLVDLVTFNLGLSGCRNTPPFWLFSVITLSWPQVAPTYIAMLLRVSLKLSGQFPENVLPVSALHAPSKLGQDAKAGFFQRYRVCGLPGSVLTLALVSLILEFFSVGPIMFRSFVPYFRSYLLINLCYLLLSLVAVQAYSKYNLLG